MSNIDNMSDEKNQVNANETLPPIEYSTINVLSSSVSMDTLDDAIQEMLLPIGGPIAVKGGFAREIFRKTLGIIDQCNYAKLEDLDIVVFETPSDIRDERIKRREEIVLLSEHFEPKDIEICNSKPDGLVHFFRTRDVTMNELVMFRNGDTLQFFYTEACLADLTSRTVRPAIHSAHTGLGEVWNYANGKLVLDASVVGRSIYRKVKGDGDRFESNQIDFIESAKSLDANDLFKIIKRFAQIPEYYKQCIQTFREIGIDEGLIEQVNVKIKDVKVKKSRGVITSEVVEDLLQERAEAFEEWLQNADIQQHSYADVLFIEA